MTGRLAGAAAGDFDLDGGVTSIRSPAITLPATGTLTLTFSYYFAHGTNSSTADFLRVQVVGTTTSTVLEELGANRERQRSLAARHGEHHRVSPARPCASSSGRRRVDGQPGGGRGG